MRIEIGVPQAGLRRWHGVLAERLTRHVAGAEVRIRFGRDAAPIEPAVEALLALERLVLRRSRETLADRLSAIPARWQATDDFRPDVVLDLGGSLPDERPAPAVRMLRPRYDGALSERALIAAILARKLPGIEIEDRPSGGVAAWGEPSAEVAAGLTGGLEAVLSRVMVLLEQVVRREPQDERAGPEPGHGRPEPGHASSVLGFALRDLLVNCTRAILRLCLYSPHWRIGWRLHDGPGVMERGDLGGPRWSVLADPGRRFFADPFPVTWAGRTVLFFEDLDHRVGKGVISAQEFGPDGPVGEAAPVLEEPWHLSYPFLIEHAGALFMVPESSLAGSVSIYRCVDFPRRWEKVGTLLDGIEAADCTIFKAGGCFWMTSATREGIGGFSDMLSIHYATDLFGPWRPHARCPALVDVGGARPAGAVVERDGRLWRPVQDCRRGYGRSLVLAEIERLDPEHFVQTVRHHVEPGPLWPGKHLHTLNRFGRLECVDGTAYNPKWSTARSIVRPFTLPQAAPAPMQLRDAPI